MIKIVDNFLPESLHTRIQDLMTGANFPWYLVTGVTTSDDDNYYFIHNLFGCTTKGVESPFFSEFEILLHFIEDKLKFQTDKLLRIKCNMYTNQNINLSHDSHTDHRFPHYTAIYYVNSNNGPTTIGDQAVDSVANRLVLFDGLTLHNSNLQTDSTSRVNINLNMQGKFLTT
jgi:hypothetical protein|tara:strand:+ start:455 stop:970 length:516 start_codon:yes stop_codon:yes gene_type:complete